MVLKIVLFFYNLAWCTVFPFLKRKPRIAEGWDQRFVKNIAPGPYDIWIQGASGGESLLTNMILARLATSFTPGEKLRVVATSGTRQGIDTLTRAKAEFADSTALEITVAYFPFDAPYLMKRAFTLFDPKLAVIIETELWPGFLITAKRCHVPVILVNGRISEKSFRSYQHWSGFFYKYGPEKILAISLTDQDRFVRLVGQERVTLMNNIKFDRVELQHDSHADSLISDLFSPDSPFIILGSIRREEEEKILPVIQQILSSRRDITIGLFPKHTERATPWLTILTQNRIPCTRRSSIQDPVQPGTVIVWDIYGELAEAYAHAKATFVGGSLVDLGGQNFLEPLIVGLKPVIGPYWQDFGWVGQEIIPLGLIHEIADEHLLADVLLTSIDSDEPRETLLQQVQQFLEPRRGGTLQTCRLVVDMLQSLNNQSSIT